MAPGQSASFEFSNLAAVATWVLGVREMRTVRAVSSPARSAGLHGQSQRANYHDISGCKRLCSTIPFVFTAPALCLLGFRRRVHALLASGIPYAI